jgi:site-specific DNA recombinase
MPEMKTAVIYTRVSTTEQADTGTSLQTQEQACRAWCTTRGLDVAAVFSDAGESAKTADRPQFLALMDWSRQHKPEVCCVWKFDRWARNSTDHAVACAALGKHGTRLVSATEAASDDPAGRLLQTVLSGIAQFDNEVRAERAKQAMRQVAMRGGWVTNAPLGFMHSRAGNLPILVEDPEWSPLIRDMFEGLAEGRRTLHQTVLLASEHRVKASNARKLLRLPAYAGVVRSKLTGGRDVQAAFPGLVSWPVWLAAQDAMDGKKHPNTYRKQHPDFPLRGVLRCSVCGRPVSGCWSRGRAGGVYGYYQCKAGHVRGRAESVHSQWVGILAGLEKYADLMTEIRTHLREMLQDHVDAAAAVVLDAEAERNRLTQRRARLLEAYLSGALGRDEFTQRDNEIAARIQAAGQNVIETGDWSADMSGAMAQCVSFLEDPVKVWGGIDVSKRVRFAKALFGDGLTLESGGVIRTAASSGLAGALAMASAERDTMAPPRGVEKNQTVLKLLDSVKEFATTCAAA